MGDTIVVTVENLAALQAEAEAAGKNVILYLDDHAIAGATPRPPSDPAGGRLFFNLKRDANSRDAWSRLLGYAHFDRPLRVSVGLEDRFAVPSRATLTFVVVPTDRLILWGLPFLAVLAAFFKLAGSSDILRDPTSHPPVGKRRPFSLGRVQAAWWFFLVFSSYLYIGVITGDFSTSITESVLVLLGISAGTVLGSAAVDSATTTPAEEIKRREALRAREEMLRAVRAAKAAIGPLAHLSAAGLAATLANLSARRAAAAAEVAGREALVREITSLDEQVQAAGGAATDTMKNTLAAKRTALEGLPLPTENVAELDRVIGILQSSGTDPSMVAAMLDLQESAAQSECDKLYGVEQNFFIDIVSDLSGVSLPRFQVVAWTLVLGVVFVVRVYQELAMPEFSATLLTLMGISNGTFVALKPTEGIKPAAMQPNPAPAGA